MKDEELLKGTLKPKEFSWETFFNVPEKEMLIILKSLDKDLLINMIRYGQNFNVNLFCGGTPFHIIIQFCDRKTFEKMLARNPNIDLFGPGRNSLYHLAMRNKKNARLYIELIHELSIKNYLDFPNLNFVTAIGQAVIENDFKVFEFIFSKDVNIFLDRTNKEYIYFLSPFYLLCKLPKTDERMKMFELLMTRKAEIKKLGYIDEPSKTREEIFSEYSNGSDTILTLACKNGHLEYVKMLLELGANPNKKNGYGEYPVLIATRNLNEEIAKLLLTLGASYDIDEDGLELFHIAQSLGLNSLAKFISNLKKTHENAMKKEMGIDDAEANRKSLELIAQMMNDGF